MQQMLHWDNSQCKHLSLIVVGVTYALFHASQWRKIYMTKVLSCMELAVILIMAFGSSLAEAGNFCILDAREERGVYTTIAVSKNLLYAYRSNIRREICGARFA